MRMLQNQQPFVLMFQTNSPAARLCHLPLMGAQIPFLIKPIPKGINISEPSPSQPGSPFSEGCACGGHPGSRERRDGAPSESEPQAENQLTFTTEM